MILKLLFNIFKQRPLVYFLGFWSSLDVLRSATGYIAWIILFFNPCITSGPNIPLSDISNIPIVIFS